MARITSWNARGLCNVTSQGSVKTLLRYARADVVFIQETKIQDVKTIVDAQMFGEDWKWLWVPSVGLSGGMILAWNSNVIVMKDYLLGAYSISITGTLVTSNVDCLLTGVYGPSNKSFLKDFWEELEDTRGWCDLPWVIGGDFNVIRFSEEKQGGCRLTRCMKEFSELIDSLELMEYPLEGASFTWSDNKVNPAMTKLDRFLFSSSWVTSFGDVKQVALPRFSSNHQAILLKACQVTKQPSPFRFELMWLEDGSLSGLIEAWWKEFNFEGDPSYVWWKKLKGLKSKLKIWNREVFGRVDRKIEARLARISELDAKEETSTLSEGEIVERCFLQDDVNYLMRMEVICCKQKGKNRVYQEAQANTKFFHIMANARRRRYSLSCLSIDGQVTRDESKIKDHIVGFYTDLYKEEFHGRPRLDGMHFNSLDDIQKDELEKHFTEEEVVLALKDMEGDKAPGPDGMPMVVYKHFWHIFKGDIMAVFHRSGFLDWRLNTTFITLIPKKERILDLKDFRPISLIGGVYKMIGKVLSLRINSSLYSLVSDTQGAFLGDRQILDSVLIANECIDERIRRKEPGILCKIDISKAYDHVYWDFLDYILGRMGFGSKWRKWIFTCVSTARFSVLVDGRPVGNFKAYRGIRQGDPLSPFLFILVMESLLRMTKYAMEKEWLDGFSIGNNVLKVGIIQFADDTLFMANATIKDLSIIKVFLFIFEAISGLKLNYSKSSIIGVGPVLEIDSLADFFGCGVDTLPTRYLGLPLGSTYKRVEAWDPVVESFHKKLGGWSRKLLSKGDRLILLKSVLSSLAVYQMSLFVIPTSVAKKLEKIMRDFWWGGRGPKKKMNLVSWEEVCAPLREGGLGFRDLQSTNIALLSKWLWRYGKEENALWRRVIDAKYGPCYIGGRPRTPRISHACSLWKGILASQDLFFEGIHHNVGNGHNTRFWKDRWCGDVALATRFKKLYRFAALKEGSVLDHLDGEGAWTFHLRRTLFRESERLELQNLNLALGEVVLNEKTDAWEWIWSKSKSFTVKSFYYQIWVLKQSDGRLAMEFPYKLVWEIDIPTNVKVFIWGLVWNKLLIVDRLKRMGWQLGNRCVLCKCEEETAPHLFLGCELATQVWNNLLGNCQEALQLVQEQQMPWG